MSPQLGIVCLSARILFMNYMFTSKYLQQKYLVKFSAA